MEEEAPSLQNRVEALTHQYTQLYQVYVDKSVPYTLYRWCGFGAVLLVFLLRILLKQGYYIVCYTLAIYLLSLFLAFISPKFDPAFEQEEQAKAQEEGGLPTAADDEFRPFIRRLPEFKFWHAATRATALALLCSFIPIFDIPVFWPILVVYFGVLAFITMRRQISHMIKYRYVPFDFGKKRFTNAGPSN